MNSDHDQHGSEERCAKCKTTVNAGATVCPACGYSPGETLKRDGWLVVTAGFLLSLTGLGVIVGVPLVYIGYKRVQKSKTLTVSYEF